MVDARSSLSESLKQSAANRAAMIQKFGFVPRSVIREIARGVLTDRLFVYQREHVDRSGSAKSRMGARAGGEVIPNVKSAAAREKVKLRTSNKLLGGVLDVKKDG